MKKKLNRYGYPTDIMIDYDIDHGKIAFGATMELASTFEIIGGDRGFVFVDGNFQLRSQGQPPKNFLSTLRMGETI